MTKKNRVGAMKCVLWVLLTFSLAACNLGIDSPPSAPQPESTPDEAIVSPTAVAVLTKPVVIQPATQTPTATPLPPTDASVFPDPNAFRWITITTGLERPVDLQSAGDGSGRLFVIEKVGRIRILQNGGLVESPFLDIDDHVGSRNNEQGLLGLAFHPNYAENGFFFINYTDNDGNTVIARYRVTSDPNIADPSSEMILLHLDQPYSNHNGGGLAFGPDGYLYAGLGDGGSGGDPFGNGQSLNVFLGKILRLDVDSAEPYAIPPDNPFGNELWAYGLRNPWRISFDSATGDLYIGDVGQNQWEEIDFIPAGSPGGQNFGWNILEGTHPYNGSEQDGLVPPVVEYSHQEGGCSITGGYVYRGEMPEWWGIYLYGDYCTGKVWGLIHSDDGWQSQVLFEAVGNITSFGQDDGGEIYIVTDGGPILRLVAR